MKFAHISDLHLGIDLNSFSLQEDQKFILDEILKIAEEEKVDGIFIAGDIFDRAIAPVEAINTFVDFLTRLQEKNIKVFAISGNHDSAERLAPGRNFMTESGIYFSAVYEGSVNCITLNDEFGEVNVYLMPFIRPGLVKHFAELKGEEVDFEKNPWNQAVDYVIEGMNLDVKKRNVLVAHQNIINAEPSDSETVIYGGLDGVSASLFADFDYTALGHIHKPQNLAENVRYCGTPLKYSLSEKDQKKSVTIVELGKKGKVKVSERELKPLRDLRLIEGTFAEIAEDFKTTKLNKNDFVSVVLRDEVEIPEIMTKLRNMYPNTFGFKYENSRTKNSKDVNELAAAARQSPLENFEKFYEYRSGLPLTDEERRIVSDLINEIWGDE